jgi:phage-related protein
MSNRVVQSIMAFAGRIEAAFNHVFGKIDISEVMLSIQQAFSDFSAWAGSIFDAASLAIADFLDSIDPEAISQAFETIKAAGDGLIRILTSIGEIAFTVFQTIILPVLENLWDLWTSTIWPGLQDIFALLQPILMTIGDMLVTAFDWLSKIAAIIGEVLGPVIDALFAWLGPKISQLIDNIKFVLTILGEDFKRTWAIVKPIVDIFVGTMLSAFGAFGTEIQKVKTMFTIVFNAIRAIVSNVISSVISTVAGIAGSISGVFWSIVSNVTNAFSNVYAIITAPFRNAFNAIKRLWNSTIGGFSFSIPAWIPGVGGKSFRIPRLATGGEITASGTVMVGESGPEMLTLPRGARVTPLDNANAVTQSETYQVMVGDVSLSDDDQVRRITREYLEFLSRIAAPSIA